MSPPPRIFFVAGEASGDLLGREVIDAIRLRSPNAEIAGVGGSEMAKAGAGSSIDIAPLSVIGLWEGLRAYGDVVRLADATTAEIVAFKPAVVVLIDSWGFTLRVARRLRVMAPEIRLVKLVGPQVWATRPGRARTLAASVDRLLCIHDFEEPYYAPFGLETTAIGHPALGRSSPGDGARFRQAHGLASDAKAILVLPGSRASEIKRVAPVLMSAARDLRRQFRGLNVIAAPEPRVADLFRKQFQGAGFEFEELAKGVTRFDAMAGVDVALACSGTVTTEVALQGAPFVTGYRVGWITYAIAKAVLFKAKFISLLNVAADRDVAPEFIQAAFTPGAIATAAAPLIGDPAARERQVDAQHAALARMRSPSGRLPADVAGEAILGEFEKGPQRALIGT